MNILKTQNTDFQQYKWGGGKMLNHKIKYSVIYFLLLFFIAFFVACKEEKKQNPTSIYFGGKIENPRSNFLLFVDNTDKIIDTLYLKKDNTFFKKIDSIKTGLYTFVHGAELQFAFVKPNDSVFVRFDSKRFDESLIFKGTRAEQNNVLLKSMLQNEKEDNFFVALRNKDYEFYKYKLDSVKQVRQAFFDNFKNNKTKYSKEFLDILKIASLYNIHKQLELYSCYNLKLNKEAVSYKDILLNRELLDLTRDEFMFYPPYNQMISSVVSDNTYLKGYKEKTDNYVNSLINETDQIVKNHKIKDMLNYYTFNTFIWYKKSTEGYAKSLNTFYHLNLDKNNDKKMKMLISDINFNKKNDRLSDFEVVSAKTNKVQNISKLIKNRRVVLFFNNPLYIEQLLADKINGFIKKFPRIRFYVINMGNKNNYFIDKLNTKYQYFLPKNSKAYQFCKSKTPRMILVNRKGIITSDFVNPFSDDIELQLSNIK